MNPLRKRKRRHYIEDHLLSDELWQASLGTLTFLNGLGDLDFSRLRELATVFIHEVEFEEGDGMKLNGQMVADIAVQAAVPILNLGMDWYANWNTVVVVPDHFESRRISRDFSGIVHEWTETNAGESWQKGPVVLSWQDVAASGRSDGFNVVIHEAAHRLDMTDGSVNGRPLLHKGMSASRWKDVCSAAFNNLRSRSGSRRRSQIDNYATVSDAEFFAVMTEYFFELPHVLRREYPDVYELFREFYMGPGIQASQS